MLKLRNITGDKILSSLAQEYKEKARKKFIPGCPRKYIKKINPEKEIHPEKKIISGDFMTNQEIDLNYLRKIKNPLKRVNNHGFINEAKASIKYFKKKKEKRFKVKDFLNLD